MFGTRPFLCVHLFARFHTLGSIGTFFLCQCAKNGQDKFAVPHVGHVGSEELGFDAESSNLRIFWSKSTIFLAKREISFTTTMSNNPCSASDFALFNLGAGDAFVSVKADKVVPCPLCIFGKEGFWGF